MTAWTLTLLRRELLLAWRHPADVLGALAFFAAVTALVPLGVGAEPQLLQRLAPGLIWIAALLATLLGLPRLFAADHADGSLEQLWLAPQPRWLLVGVKCAAHWLLSGLPLLLLAPLLALQYGLPTEALHSLLWSLLLGTPGLSLLGAVFAALSLGTRGGAVLVALLSLPFYAPALVFGAGAVSAVQAGLPAQAHLQLLAGLSLLALALAPWTASAALGLALE
ncbi:heme exporter protein CcmB [Pelomonas sp. BJYL3]|uniref:heme exporter protein CcmB n=1 Tax=Pelomonas sp. BJYL3 TaxID=2976697 RepID=UPI0022B2D20F|nr:heme exporter protein CcmB [Pelomonas sp. BJYL3]